MLQASFDEMVVLMAVNQAMTITAAAQKAATLYPSIKFDEAVARRAVLTMVDRKLLNLENGMLWITGSGQDVLNSFAEVLADLADSLTRRCRGY